MAGTGRMRPAFFVATQRRAGHLDPHRVFCPKTDCPDKGRVGAGTIGIHSQKERRS